MDAGTPTSETPLMITFHPSYLLRNQSNTEKRKVWEDMLLVFDASGAARSTEKQRNFFGSAEVLGRRESRMWDSCFLPNRIRGCAAESRSSGQPIQRLTDHVVTHAIRLGSLGFGSGFVSNGTTRRLASTACTKFERRSPCSRECNAPRSEPRWRRPQE